MQLPKAGCRGPVLRSKKNACTAARKMRAPQREVAPARRNKSSPEHSSEDPVRPSRSSQGMRMDTKLFSNSSCPHSLLKGAATHTRRSTQKARVGGNGPETRTNCSVPREDLLHDFHLLLKTKTCSPDFPPLTFTRFFICTSGE